MKIVNNTDLSYKEIGSIIDELIENGKEDTYYFGKKDVEFIRYKDEVIRIEIRYLKRYVEWRFY